MASTITTSPKAPLSERSTNTRLPTITPMESSKATGDDNATELKVATVQSMEYHRQVLKERLEEGKLQYVFTTFVCGLLSYGLDMCTDFIRL